MTLSKEKDPMGKAIADFWRNGKAGRLRVFSPMFEEDEIPVSYLFRTVEEMSPMEQEALRMAQGKTLDVGAGAGCHALALQEQGIDVTAIDISPLSVEVMQARGVQNACLVNFYSLDTQFDTILMLMNGIGIVGTLQGMPRFFQLLDSILAPGGQVIFDSSDIKYVFENEDGTIEFPDSESYYGELTYRMQYKNILGNPFPWLYIDAATLSAQAKQYGYTVEIIVQGQHYDYLARIAKSCVMA